MAKRERYDVLVILTNNAALIWKEARGIAPESAADKLRDKGTGVLTHNDYMWY